MMNRFFNVVLCKDAYVNDEEKQDGLRRALIDENVEPIDVKEADIITAGTGEKALEVLIVKCLESMPLAKDMFRLNHNMIEIEYEGLPTLI